MSGLIFEIVTKPLPIDFLMQLVASMRYLQMPLPGVAGYIIFHETMNIGGNFFGALVIISSCLLIAWRELVRARKVNQPGI